MAKTSIFQKIKIAYCAAKIALRQMKEAETRETKKAAFSREWLIATRKAKGFTQAQIAEKAGICRTYYTRIEGGQFDIPAKTAQRIAAALGFDWTEFYKAS